MMMKFKGHELTTSFEGLRLEAYLDTGGVPTIGYGHTAGVRMGQKITKEQALKFLDEDIAEAVEAVNYLVKVSLTQNQFDALVDFTFNVGSGALGSSTLLRKLNVGDYEGAAQELLRWNKDNGKVIAGLTRRREAERKLFLT